jgi:hypothetical protein
VQSWLILAFALLATPFHCVAQSAAAADLQWISVKDQRLQWLNVTDWEPKGDGLQPVRVPKIWRDKWAGAHRRTGTISRRRHSEVSHRFQKACIARHVRRSTGNSWYA